MRLSIFVAYRYLFSKKKQGAINIISLISVVGVAIGSAALILILSVFNGIDSLLVDNNKSYTADIVVESSNSKFFTPDTVERLINVMYPEVVSLSVLQERALLKYGGLLQPVVIKAVDSAYLVNSGFAKKIIKSSHNDYFVNSNEAAVGVGVAVNMHINVNALEKIDLYYPNIDRKGLDSPLRSISLYPTSLYSTDQMMDAAVVFINKRRGEYLFSNNQVSQIELYLPKTSSLEINDIENGLQNKLGTQYEVKNRSEMNASFYAMMKGEKFAILVILLFILFIASFNIVASISMLILDKKEDLSTYRALGMSHKDIISVFRNEGIYITLIGVLSGLFVGGILAYLQQTFGLLKLGDGSYIVSAYPVKLLLTDVFLTFLSVLVIGGIASHFPVHYLVNRLLK